jgi:cell division septum initiation protein DivIVA
MVILSLLDSLEQLITSSQRIPMTNRVLVSEQEMLQLVDQIRAAVPEEIKQAHRLRQERERLLAQAQAEANRIIAAAREEAERLINDEELLRVAAERASEIEAEAEAQAGQLRDGADTYAVETLRSLEERLDGVQVLLERTLLSIHKGLETLNERARARRAEDLKGQPEESEGEDEEREGTLLARSVPQHPG